MTEPLALQVTGPGCLTWEDGQHPITILPEMWDRLAAHIAAESALSARPASTLAARWEHGLAAVALHHGEIIAYSSVIPAYTSHHRPILSRLVGPDRADLPAVEVYESTTGWTHTDWRRKNINMILRERLYARFSGCLLAGVTFGVGASPVLLKMGWSRVAWTACAYVSSLIGWVEAERCHRPGLGWHTLSEAQQAAGDTFRFWVSDADLARNLNHRFAATVGELGQWRHAISALPCSIYR